jgi:hypothetical protein
MAELRKLMRDDVAMVEDLQIARSEMPEAIRTLERAVERIVEDEQIDAEESPKAPSTSQETRKNINPSLDHGSTGASRTGADVLATNSS